MAKTNREKRQKSGGRRWDLRRTAVAVLALAMALLLLLPMVSMVFQVAGAVSQDELQAQIDAGKAQAADLNAQIDELDDQLAAIRDDKSSAQEQKNLLEQQINAQNTAIASAERMIAQYDALIAEKESEVAETQAQEEEQFELFCQRVRAMEETGTTSYWDILFGAADFSDLLDRMALIGEVMDYDNQVMDELAALRQQLQDQQAQLKTSRAEQQTEKEDLEARRADLQAREAEVQQLIDDINADEAQAQAAKDALEAAASEIDAQVAQKQRELQALLDAGKITFDPGTGYVWPVPGNYRITSLFGPRIHPITGRPGNHTGTDIAAPGGTPIHAARGGVITISTYNNSYGNYVVVQHDNGVSTLYAHMRSRAVQEGDIVEQNQVIGYVGTTGSSTGNHLHLEFRDNGTRQDALSYYPALEAQFIYS